MNNMKLPKARREGLVIQNANDELLVYDLKAERAMCLNETAAAVWQACEGDKTIAQISELISEKGDEQGEHIVWLALDQLSSNNLLDDNFKNPRLENRREVLKKVGVATAVAIPVVASLTAPSNVLASASCACAAPGDCLTQPGCTSSICNPSGICAP